MTDNRSLGRRVLAALLGVPPVDPDLRTALDATTRYADALNVALRHAENLLEALYDRDPCCVTVGAFCQAHGFLVAPDCPNEVARQFLIRRGVISE